MRKAAGNSTYPKLAVQWLNQALFINQSLCIFDSEALRSRQLWVAANRYLQAYRTDTENSTDKKKQQKSLRLNNLD